MSVLFHFSLSLSNYEFRRNLSTSQRNQRSTDSLIRNRPADEGPSTSESNYNQIDDEKMSPTNETTALIIIPRKNFFKSPLLYQNALMYVFSRLFMTTSLIYMPLWLNERSYVPAPPSNVTTTFEIYSGSKNLENIAVSFFLIISLLSLKMFFFTQTVPLVSFIASFIASMVFKQSVRFTGHKIGYLIGSLISISGCFWVALKATPDSSVYELYLVAILFGTGSSITMIASLSITAEIIGPHADQGGIIYSVVTFCGLYFMFLFYQNKINLFSLTFRQTYNWCSCGCNRNYVSYKIFVRLSKTQINLCTICLANVRNEKIVPVTIGMSFRGLVAYQLF
jgi:uncharacterized membrane protein YuzA (DUF378 family)